VKHFGGGGWKVRDLSLTYTQRFATLGFENFSFTDR
jgi:hypothetical protein